MRDTTANSRPVHTRAAALLLALALAGPASSLAQPAGEAEESADNRDVASPDATNHSDDGVEDTGSGEGVVLSPFDYEASESISEDASVSFPVDI